MPNAGLTHFDEGGAAIMVDVSGKEKTHREAIASGRIYVSDAVYAAIEGGTAAKGDVLGVARIAGIMAAKRTSDTIPLCHPLPLAKCTLDFADSGKGQLFQHTPSKDYLRQICYDALPDGFRHRVRLGNDRAYSIL